MEKKKTIWAGAAALATLIMPVQATGGIAGSQLGAGLLALVRDVTTFLLILCPLVGGGFAVYFIIRRSMADEQDTKMWEKRIKGAVISAVAGMLVSGIIALITSYFEAAA